MCQVFTGSVAVDDCLAEDEGLAGLDWAGEDGAGVGRDAGSWLVREALPSRSFLFYQWTLWLTTTTSVWTGLIRSGVLVRWSSASGSPQSLSVQTLISHSSSSSFL